MVELTTTQKVTSGSAILLSILAIVMSSGLLNQESKKIIEAEESQAPRSPFSP